MLQERLRHAKYPKGIVKYIEKIEDQEYIYIVTALMNQGDLASYMRSHHIVYLSESELLDKVHSITKSLKAIHEHGFLHNDLQPCNLYLHKKSSQRNGSSLSVKLGGFAKC